MTLVAISAGHGIDTPGKRTPVMPDGVIMLENAFNEPVAHLLEQHLKRNGFDVLQVAPEEESTPLARRCERANAQNADVFIAIHANASIGRWNDTGGIETYVLKKGFNAERLALHVHQNLLMGTPLNDRGIKEANYYVLRATDMPAILVELGFMDNLREAYLLRSEQYRRECAEEIARGVCAYFDVRYEGEDKVNLLLADLEDIVNKYRG